MYSDNKILSGIRNNNNKIIKWLYKNYYPIIQKKILNDQGSDEDAKEIFQEAIIIIYLKIRDNNLILYCSLKKYFLAVCRKIWIKQLYKKQKRDIQFLNDDFFLESDNDIIKMYEQNERYRLYMKHYLRLHVKCRKILRLYMEKVSFKKIAEIMNFKNEQQAIK